MLANQQKKEGKTDLAEFIAYRGSKAVDEALAVGWEIEEAGKKLERCKSSRIDILYREMGKQCVDGCGRRWLHMAEDILQRDNIQKLEFAEAVRNLPKKWQREIPQHSFKRARELWENIFTQSLEYSVQNLH